jgi:hypothetical protein
MWSPHDATSAFPSSSKGLASLHWTERPDLGVGTTGDYWLRRLHARDSKAELAKIKAYSGDRPVHRITARPDQGVYHDPKLGAAVLNDQHWFRGQAPARKPVIRLRLTNVGSLRVLLHDAGFRHGAGRLKVRTDGPVVIHLGGRTVRVAKGAHVVRFRA